MWSDAAGVRLWYEEAGSGPPLVLLHGLGGSSADWEAQIAEFARDHRVIAPDLRGYGASERRGPYSVAQFAADVCALLDALGVGSFTLIGHSMGGAVAMQMALERPQRVERLVLTNTLPSFRPRRLRHRLMLWARLLVMGLLGPGYLGRRVAAQLYRGPELAALRDRAGRRSARNGRGVYLRTLWQLARWSVEPRLADLRMPILVMAAEEDYFDNADLRRFIAGLPAPAESEVFAGTRHGLPLEAPQRFNARLRSFLQAAAA